MAFDTKHHCFASALDHLALPVGFSCQIAQFSHVMYFHWAFLDSAPFTFLCSEAFS